jgi:hypothetical protein
MNFNDFKGAAKPLDEIDVPMLAHRLRVSEDHIRALIEVEAGGQPFDSQGRPAMLFEPHLFWRNLGDGPKRAQAAAQGIAYPNWKPGGYPADSYPRLKQAMAIDETAALKSASWGASQILGQNHALIGFATVQNMVRAFMNDAQEHIEGMIRFILANGIDEDLRANRWASVARAYNGPGYAANGYDRKLAMAYAKWSGRPDVAWSPDRPDPSRPHNLDREQLRSVQKQLRDLGYPEVGTADGVWGTKTRAAVLAFRADNGLPIVAAIDEEFLKVLPTAPRRGIAPERAEATVEDLRKQGSRTIEVTDTGKTVGAVVGGAGGAVTAIAALHGIIEQIKGLEGAAAFLEPVAAYFGIESSILFAAIGAYMWWENAQVQKVRLDDHRTGRNVGR